MKYVPHLELLLILCLPVCFVFTMRATRWSVKYGYTIVLLENCLTWKLVGKKATCDIYNCCMLGIRATLSLSHVCFSEFFASRGVFPWRRNKLSWTGSLVRQVGQGCMIYCTVWKHLWYRAFAALMDRVGGGLHYSIYTFWIVELNVSHGVVIFLGFCMTYTTISHFETLLLHWDKDHIIMIYCFLC